MKNILLILAIVINNSILFSQNNLTYENDSIKCKYKKENGLLNGKYQSFYKSNNKKKAEGYFKNNNRSGVWTIWDKYGNIVAQRNYKSSYNFEQLVPDKPKPLKYTPKYNSDKYLEYFQLKEKNIVWSKKVYSIISPKNNPILFSNNTLNNVLFENIKNENIQIYSDDGFSNKLNINDFDINKNIEYYIVNEVFVYDSERALSEKRIIGISPKFKNSKKSFWIYFPSTRKYLAQQRVVVNNNIKYIKSLDDLFFYNYYSENILPVTNIFYTNEINETIRDIENESSNDIEITIIEIEHDIWVGSF